MLASLVFQPDSAPAFSSKPMSIGRIHKHAALKPTWRRAVTDDLKEEAPPAEADLKDDLKLVTEQQGLEIGNPTRNPDSGPDSGL